MFKLTFPLNKYIYVNRRTNANPAAFDNFAKSYFGVRPLLQPPLLPLALQPFKFLPDFGGGPPPFDHLKGQEFTWAGHQLGTNKTLLVRRGLPCKPGGLSRLLGRTSFSGDLGEEIPPTHARPRLKLSNPRQERRLNYPRGQER